MIKDFVWGFASVLVVASLAFGCAAATPLINSALEIVGPAAVNALSQAVLDEYGSDAHVLMESAGCFPVSNVQDVAALVGDDQEEYLYIACRVKVLQ